MVVDGERGREGKGGWDRDVYEAVDE